MTKNFIYNYIRQQKLAIIATIAKDNSPEAALVGIAVTEDLEIVFDTVNTSRKYQNILQNPLVAMVIGWDNETTIQYEGTAIELNEYDDKKYKEIYFETFPDGKQRADTWPGLVHFRITPKWIRYSNFNEPQQIEEMKF